MNRTRVLIRCARRWIMTMLVVSICWIGFERAVVGLLVVGIALVAVEAAVTRVRWGEDEPPPSARAGAAHVAIALAVALFSLPALLATAPEPADSAPVAEADWPMPNYEAAKARYRALHG